MVQLTLEPTVILYTLLTAITTVQWSTVSMPNWAHVVATVVVAILTAITNRQVVTPTNVP